ncbi:hypothetical protein DFJ73DRAFT_364177 [Zopfochytrium polystomum]|nr:hypothetical protein DFJ73DRAFT_364177 [Zopfochytrium polystomum]
MEDTVSFRSRSGRRLGDDDEEVSMEIDDEGAEAGAAQATFDAEEARSPSPCEVKSSKLAASSRRDSVAAFFRSPQPPRQPLAQAGPSSRRDSVAPFFAGWGHRSNEDVDEIAAFGGRSGDDHDYNPDEEDDEDGTDTFGHDKISKATAGAAMLQLRNERPRDSIAAFFPDSHADESSQSKSLASAGLRPRDSIAAFFPDSHQADDTQSISFAPRSVNNEAHKRKERARDSVAAFFQDPEGDDDEIAMTGLTALKAHAKNERPRDSVAAFFAGTESDSEEEDSAVVGAVEQGPEDNLRHPEDTNSDEQTSMDITRSHGGRLKQDRPGSALHGPYPPVVPVETPEIIRQSRATRSAPPSKDTTPLRRSSRLRSMSPAASDGLSTPQQAPSKSSSRKGTPLKPSLKRDATPRREATPRSNVKRIKSPDVATTPPELEDVRSSVTLVPPTYSGSASPTPASGPRGELAARKPKESQPATMSTPRSAQKDDLAMMKEPLLGTPKALLSAKRDYHLTPRMQKLLSKTNDEISLPDRNWLRDYDSDKTGPSALPKLFQKKDLFGCFTVAPQASRVFPR